MSLPAAYSAGSRIGLGIGPANNAPDELAARRLKGSVERRGNPYDNAESFMKTLKAEAVYPMAFETIDDVADYLPRFIEDIYNGRRPHSACGYLSPKQFEDRFTRQTVKSAA